MSEFHEGDRVVAVAGETTITGKLWGCEELFVGVSRRTVKSLLDDSFAVTVIEKAAPPRPWLDAEVGETWHLEPFGCNYNVVRSVDRYFTRANVFGAVDVVPLDDDRITDAVKLEPVPVTAKRFAERLNKVRTGTDQSIALDIDQVATEFGVTE